MLSNKHIQAEWNSPRLGIFKQNSFLTQAILRLCRSKSCVFDTCFEKKKLDHIRQQKKTIKPTARFFFATTCSVFWSCYLTKNYVAFVFFGAPQFRGAFQLDDVCFKRVKAGGLVGTHQVAGTWIFFWTKKISWRFENWGWLVLKRILADYFFKMYIPIFSCSKVLGCKFM